MNRIYNAKLILWAILGIGLAVAITRFIYGLGVTTNLSDNTPWGFWIGFDVMGGVALAAGGFVIAGLNYIFGKKEFHSITRAAILTAFLGYIAVVIGLLFDLGLPWNIWHMIIFWNPHSPLFEVGWCVMLYLTVLTLEFTPVALEKYPNIPFLRKIYNFLNKIKIPIVILGIMLSTLHQSSLGSLFLAMPYKLHPLWYSPIIPVIFFISAIYLGLMMVMVESMTSSYLYHKEFEINILKKLRLYASVMMVVYAVLRFGDIIFRGAAGFLFYNEWGTYLFWTEILISLLIPFIIFNIKSLYNNINLVYIAALSGVFGIVLNRLNVGGLTHLNNLTDIGEFYFPSWMELSISAGVVSLAMLLFFFFIENFNVWDEPPIENDVLPEIKPQFNSFNVYLGPKKIANRVKSSFIFVIAFSFSFAFISSSELEKKGAEIIKVTKARGGDTLIIDGNRNDFGVIFKHKMHEQLGYDCSYCHHINKPTDKATGCYECHSYMYTTNDVFRHDWHTSNYGANLKCNKCHPKNYSKGKDYYNNPGIIISKCFECHNNWKSNTQFVIINTYYADSYTDAMHYLCINCHQRSLEKNNELAIQKPNLAKCINCHYKLEKFMKKNELFSKPDNLNKWVVVPSKFSK